MTNTIMRIVTTHCTNHIERGEADAVWGEVLCADANVDRRLIDGPSRWRIISFDGRRGKQISLRPKEYGSRMSAESAFDSKLAAKLREGYKTVEWVNPYYGLMPVIRDIDRDFFDMVVAESTRLGMSLDSPLWRAVSGKNGYSIPIEELINNFNSSNPWAADSRNLAAQRRRDILEEQTASSGRFAPDPTLGAHIFLWNGGSRDPDFERCGVCNKKLSKHARLVINYRGRLARHIWRQKDTGSWQCRYCNLERDGTPGRLVHSALGDSVEYISGQDAARVTAVGSALQTYAELEVADLVPEPPEPTQVIFEELLIPRKPPVERKRLPDSNAEPQSHERTGGLLDFDI